jgi:hypothetical protein
MQSLRQTDPNPGQIITPHEPTQEFREFVGALHAVAEDNLDDLALTAAKFALNAFGRVFSASNRSTARTTTIGTTNEYGDFYPIPDDAGDPWFVTRTTGDGLLEGSLGVTFISTVPAGLRVWIGVLIDGKLEAQSPILNGLSFEDSLHVEFGIPVGSGPHRIDAVFGYHDHPVANQVIQWNEGNMLHREVAR